MKNGSCEIIKSNFESVILTSSEDDSLYEMIGKRVRRLLYRATRDGFKVSAFHSRCDGKANTITIIKNNLNYVFGGYASSAWHSNNAEISDSYAFIISLRRAGISKLEKYRVTTITHALTGYSTQGPTFGATSESAIQINEDSNIKTGSHTYFCEYYECPLGYSPGTVSDYTRSYLAGNYDNWLATEIEVYQLE